MRTRANVSHFAKRVRRGVSDMSYAQQRVFENQTGIGTRGPDRRRGSAEPSRPGADSRTRDLEALYAQDVKTTWR